jgi:hypothetical protein
MDELAPPSSYTIYRVTIHRDGEPDEEHWHLIPNHTVGVLQFEAKLRDEYSLYEASFTKFTNAISGWEYASTLEQLRNTKRELKSKTNLVADLQRRLRIEAGV